MNKHCSMKWYYLLTCHQQWQEQLATKDGIVKTKKPKPEVLSTRHKEQMEKHKHSLGRFVWICRQNLIGLICSATCLMFCLTETNSQHLLHNIWNLFLFSSILSYSTRNLKGRWQLLFTHVIKLEKHREILKYPLVS